MTDPEEKEAESEVSVHACRDIGRLNSLSDGVFAFALTLLVLSLQVPLLTSRDTSVVLGEKLIAEWPIFMSYLISFGVIAAWWRVHHWIYGQIRRCNQTLISLNFAFLLCITVIPFLTNLLSLEGDIFLATTLYAVIQSAAGFLMIGIWLYASHGSRLIDPRLKYRTIRFVTLRIFTAPAAFLISIPIAFFSTTAAQLSWILIPVFRVAVFRFYSDLREDIVDHRDKVKKQA
jgi:uncharacterized membrane protein